MSSARCIFPEGAKPILSHAAHARTHTRLYICTPPGHTHLPRDIRGLSFLDQNSASPHQNAGTVVPTSAHIHSLHLSCTALDAATRVMPSNSQTHRGYTCCGTYTPLIHTLKCPL